MHKVIPTFELNYAFVILGYKKYSCLYLYAYYIWIYKKRLNKD